MLRKMMAALGVAALLAALAGPALAQEKEMVWNTDGKRYWRTEELRLPVEQPATALVAVPAGEQACGGFLGFLYVGKRMEPVTFQEVPLAPALTQGHECTWRMVYEMKAVNKRHFCLVNGAEKPCPGMGEGGACVGMK